MRRIGEFDVSAKALGDGQFEPFRPGLMIERPKGTITGLVEIGDPGDREMSEEAAHDVASFALNDVIRVADNGQTLFLADDAIQVSVVFSAGPALVTPVRNSAHGLPAMC